MKKTYSVWFKADYKRGHFTKKTMREIVEESFPIENVDDLKGLLDEVKELRQWAENEKTLLEFNDENEIRIQVNPGTYAVIDYESIKEGTELLDDLVEELSDHAERLEDIIRENEDE